VTADLLLERRPLEQLLPYAANARTHSDEQVVQIAASIAEFGFANPVLIDERGVLIAGHGRLLAARRLGLTDVPVIRLSHLTDAQARAFRIADNRIADNGGWDEAALSAELARLTEDGFDLDLLGFAEEELARLLDGSEDCDGEGAAADDDAVPEAPSDPASRPGDLWLLGDHRLLCGDAVVLDDVERALGGSRAAMCFTDSPYNVDYTGGPKADRQGKGRRIRNDALGDDFGRFLHDACVNILTVTDGGVYMCMSSSELHTLHQAFVSAGGHWSTFVIWAKNAFTLGRADYQRQYEPILYGWKEGVRRHWCGARDQGDVWFVNKPAVNDLHPTMKPVELIERAVLNSSRDGDIVLDPFGGSGSTLVACEKQGRCARLIELDPKYCDVIVQRWQTLTGRSATLDGDGRTFGETVAGRMA
jgi:DNA modification methylase